MRACWTTLEAVAARFDAEDHTEPHPHPPPVDGAATGAGAAAGGDEDDAATVTGTAADEPLLPAAVVAAPARVMELVLRVLSVLRRPAAMEDDAGPEMLVVVLE